VDDTPTRPTASDVSWWASAASLDTAHLGSNYRIDDNTYQLLSEVDEDEDRQGKAKGENESETASGVALCNINCNGMG
jgi:hypothetical protein